MAYRNKTFISFASEDIKSYYLMCAWNENEKIDFNFHDAHDLNTALDTSKPETIDRRLRERLINTKQVILLVGNKTRAKSTDSESFLYYEVNTILKLGLPVIFANLNGSRAADSSRTPKALGAQYTISTSFQPKILKYALDEFPDAHAANLKAEAQKTGHYEYKGSVYEKLGL